MQSGWLKLHRSLIKHPVWATSSPEQKTILIVILCMVNHTPNKWAWGGDVFEVEAGQMVTSLESIRLECGKGISIQNVRTALTKFKKFNFLTEQLTSHGRVVSIVNWGTYQDSEITYHIAVNTDLTKGSQSTNKALTPIEEGKNNKKDKNEINKLPLEILEFLNKEKGGRGFSPTPTNLKNIKARIKEGFSKEDFEAVITFKKTLLNDPQFKQYFRPSTLFSADKFEGYLITAKEAPVGQQAWGQPQNQERDLSHLIGTEPPKGAG